ncbi:hypothetical protein MRB53_014646 [Persea americana]|uniref:Uncharacterized protein n=1 Tax=Persea americana TaxID=3435 RepID=A0ACC2KC13_PERAE|nr:hypothetical protein MRB53_014646 [Persea americana]
MGAERPQQNAAAPIVCNNPRVDARHVAKLRRAYVFTVLFVAITVGLYLIGQKWLIPRAPKISVSVSSFKISSTRVTADWGRVAIRCTEEVQGQDLLVREILDIVLIKILLGDSRKKL